ncbi:YceI like family protein [Mizugakiibacter sediminis]|uniref:Polyisoprenoid-binding protein n=2 Tax=Mizugakiibacter sediminis TaxID=1475481 RepID=A0A0K8QQC4_9GAMM|nr:YceI like family protein [Mizugakiibacter sediminis]
MRRFPWFALPLLAAAAARAAPPQDYRIDPVHSQVIFCVDHDGFSTPCGRLRVAAGWLHFDRDDWSRSRVVADIDLASVDMGDAGWEKAVRGRDFLDAKRAPLAHFESVSVQRRDDDHGVLHGTLTLRGASREVTIPFTVNRVGITAFGLHTIAGFSGAVTLARRDFGMTAFAKSIGADVQVRLEIEAILDSRAPELYRQYEATHAATQQ